MSEETKEPISKITLFLRYAVDMLLTFVIAARVAWFSHEIILENALNGHFSCSYINIMYYLCTAFHEFYRVIN